MAAKKKVPPPSALRELIRGVLDVSGISHSELARRSGLSPQAISTYLGGRQMKTLPLPSTILGLARGLGVPQSAVIAACYQDVGYEIEITLDDPAMSVILAVARDLDAPSRERLAKIAQTFL